MHLIKNIEDTKDPTEKVRTLENLEKQEIEDKLMSEIVSLIGKKVRTLKTHIIPIKNAPEGAKSKYGAARGSLLELGNEIIQMLLHKETIILCENILKFYKNK